MKQLQSILAVVALVLLVVPCVHADEHRHTEGAHALGAPLCGHCESCSEEPCSRPDVVAFRLEGASAVDIPVRLVQQIAVFTHSVPVSPPAPRPPGGLQLLQTVHLLL